MASSVWERWYLVLSSEFHCTTRVRTIRSNSHQRVVQGYPLSPTRSCAAQQTGAVVNRKLVSPSRKCSCAFLALYSDFLRNTRLTLLTGGRKFSHAYESSRSSHVSALHWNPPDFRKKNKVGYFSNISCITIKGKTEYCLDYFDYLSRNESSQLFQII